MNECNKSDELSSFREKRLQMYTDNEAVRAIINSCINNLYNHSDYELVTELTDYLEEITEKLEKIEVLVRGDNNEL